jgi:hypothetical protein
MDDATHFLAANNVTYLANRLLDEDDEAARAHWRRLLLVEVNKFGQPAERLARVELQIAAADRRLGRLRRLTGAATAAQPSRPGSSCVRSTFWKADSCCRRSRATLRPGWAPERDRRRGACVDQPAPRLPPASPDWPERRARP